MTDRQEQRFLDLIANMSEAEQMELLAFIEFLLERQDQGLTVSEEEAYQRGIEAGKRIKEKEGRL